ncbi:MAG: Gfo/Idh/MocA family oxidoreductase, partial [Chloroflexi bacterium]|nr:Gfo/Idh/MocA family oxidoreductase [Chloroflexota bacterium]
FIAEKYKVCVYTDYRDLLVKEKPDVVSIVVPTKDHVAVALDCVRAGAHLLIEKPIASTVGEAQIIINAARIANCKLMVGHIVRFNPAVMEMKKRLDADELGRIFQIVCRREGPFPARIRDVGVVVDLAPHDIDIIRYLSGSDLIRLYAETEKRIHTEHEDLMIAIMRLQNGITAALNINWLTPAKIREITVVGEKGMFKVDDLTQDLYFYENSLAVQEIWDSLKTISGVNPGKMIRFAIDRVEPLKKEIFSFVQAIENDSIMPVSGEDGLQALRIASALVESGLSHQVIEL